MALGGLFLNREIFPCPTVYLLHVPESTLRTTKPRFMEKSAKILSRLRSMVRIKLRKWLSIQ